MKRPLTLALLVACSAANAAAADEPRITFLRLPEGCVQPQALADAGGRLHVVALRGEPQAAEVVYFTNARPGSADLAPPVLVADAASAAIAVGSIRGAQIALGRDGRVHVAWNGGDGAEPRNPFGGAPVLYARSNPERTAFEPARNLMTSTSVLDGGADVAADGAGHVFVLWHGSAEDAAPGEAGRRLYVARSADDGATFTPERPALSERDATGICPCCGVKAFVGADGTLAVLFRDARTPLDRDLVLASSADRGQTFRLRPISPWRIKTCPMSRAAMASAPSGLLAAWEADDRIAWAHLDPRSGEVAEPAPAPGRVKQRHPALAANARGEVLLAWTEKTDWQKGGDLAWQLYDADGRPTAARGRREGGIPVWGIPAVVARADGSFLVIH